MKWSDIQKVRLGAERTLARGLRRHVRCRLGESRPEERAKRRREYLDDCRAVIDKTLERRFEELERRMGSEP